MKSWLILVWLVTFTGDWLNGAEGDKQCPASKVPLQAAAHNSTGDEEANNGIRQEAVICREDPPQTREDPERTLGKGGEDGGEREGQETQQGLVQKGPGGEESTGCKAASSMTEGEGEADQATGMSGPGGVPERHTSEIQSTMELSKKPDKELSKKPDKGFDEESAKEPDKGLDEESDKGLDEESAKEPDKGLDEESAKEPDKGLDEESAKKPDKGLDEESAKEPDKGLDEESAKEPDKGLDEESAKKPDKGLDEESDKEPAKELEKESAKEPTKEPTAAPTTEAATVPVTTPQRCPPSDPWGSCGDDSKEESPMVAKALTDFALNFYSKLVKVEGTGSNVVFSPFSVALALSHLLLGARGETKERLESILSYPSNLVCVHTALQRLLKSQPLISASKLFLRQGLHLNEAFRNQSLRFYNSRPHVLSGNETQDLRFINKWVKDVTKGKIKRLLKELEPDVQLVLLNAVYFQSKWKTTFKVKNTVNETFYRPGQAPIQVPMMTSKKYPLAFFNDPSLQAKVGRLQLSHNMSLIVIVPQHVSQMLAQLEQKLTKETFTAVMKKLMGVPFKPTVVSLPKLKLDSSQDLMDILGEMDYGIFYDSNLCGISETEDLLVTSAQHRAMLELNEEGVEAAAATAFSVARTAWVFDVQQPFLFVLWNDDHSFPIFMGHVNDPRV